MGGVIVIVNLKKKKITPIYIYIYMHGIAWMIYIKRVLLVSWPSRHKR
jgi:hypothetical protein